MRVGFDLPVSNRSRSDLPYSGRFIFSQERLVAVLQETRVLVPKPLACDVLSTRKRLVAAGQRSGRLRDVERASYSPGGI